MTKILTAFCNLKINRTNSIQNFVKTKTIMMVFNIILVHKNLLETESIKTFSIVISLMQMTKNNKAPILPINIDH